MNRIFGLQVGAFFGWMIGYFWNVRELMSVWTLDGFGTVVATQMIPFAPDATMSTGIFSAVISLSWIVKAMHKLWSPSIIFILNTNNKNPSSWDWEALRKVKGNCVTIADGTLKCDRSSIQECLKFLRKGLQPIDFEHVNWKYKLTEDYAHNLTKITPHFTGEQDVHTVGPKDKPVLRLKKDRLVICAGYAWDGASGPTVDTPSSMRASLVHDALYQCMRNGHLKRSDRIPADRIFYKILKEDGMWLPRRIVWFLGVVLFGTGAARPNSPITVIKFQDKWHWSASSSDGRFRANSVCYDYQWKAREAANQFRRERWRIKIK